MFKQDSTASLLAGFQSIVDKLTAVAKRAQQKASDITHKLLALQDEREAAYNEANAANATAAKIATLIGGAV